MIIYAKKYINTGHSWIKFDIDNNVIINRLGVFYYDFGELRKIKSNLNPFPKNLPLHQKQIIPTSLLSQSLQLYHSDKVLYYIIHFIRTNLCNTTLIILSRI